MHRRLRTLEPSLEAAVEDVGEEKSTRRLKHIKQPKDSLGTNGEAFKGLNVLIKLKILHRRNYTKEK